MSAAKAGIWMPTASVICFECHGPDFPRSDYDRGNKRWYNYTETVSEQEWERVNSEEELEEGNGITFCDKCGASIQLDESVATEHNLMRRLREHGIDSEMMQTGGMNSACEIHVDEGDGYYWATYSFDGDGMWWVVRYDEEGVPTTDSDEFIHTDSDDEVFQFLMEQEDVKRL